MSDLPEHVRVEIPELAHWSQMIDGLQDQLRAARAEHIQLINNEAQKVARFSVGYEYEDRKGKRFRITKISGDYIKYDHLEVPIIWVRYRGVQLFKKGTESSERIVYPPNVDHHHGATNGC